MPIWLIARSEYLRRVRSWWFIGTTLLAPVLTLVVMLIPAFVLSLGEDAPRRVAVRDETGVLAPALLANPPEGYDLFETARSEDSLRAAVRSGLLQTALVLPAGLLDGSAEALLLSRSGGGLTQHAVLRAAVREAVREARVQASGAPPELIGLLREGAPIRAVTLGDRGEAPEGAIASTVLANLLGLLIYMAVLLYGAMVMRGVIEEKAGRIVEVMASSVRPFELLMGKVLGIGAVGLTQLAAWGLLLVGMSAAAGPLLALLLAGAAGADVDEFPLDLSALPLLLSPGLLVAFVLFFLGGFLLFASLFAAVGSAVDQEADAQTLQVPILLPIIVPLFFLPYVLDRPEAPLSVFLSLFPLSSPTLMVVRMAVADVPVWQVTLSFALLAATFTVMIALAARIYRVGMLMYGKRASLRELWRWLRAA
ncbi:MAG: ABC transporter permease [Rubricoccaceae bacterium]